MRTPSLFPDAVLVSYGCSPLQTLPDNALYTNMLHHVPVLVHINIAAITRDFLVGGEKRRWDALSLHPLLPQQLPGAPRVGQPHEEA